MRILWIGPNYAERYNSHHESLPTATAKINDVIRYGHGKPPCVCWGLGQHVPTLVENYHPDLIVIQHPRHCHKYTGLDEIRIPKAVVLCDYFPRNQALKNNFLSRNKIDAVFFPESTMLLIAEDAKRKGAIPAKTRLRWLPFWADIDRFKPLGTTVKIYHAMCLFSAGNDQPNRLTVAAVLDNLSPELHVLARVVRTGKSKITGNDYVELINQSIIAVTANDRHGSVNLKHFEFPACGTLMLSDKAADFDALGFRDQEHYVEYKNPKDLPVLIRTYLKSETARTRIEERALELIQEYHTVDIRAKQLSEELCRLF